MRHAIGIVITLAACSLSAGATSQPPLRMKSEGPTQPAKLQDGQYTDKNGDPTYHITNGGKTVDWYTMSGYVRYNSNCIVCHGPDGMGSTYAPSLVDALKGMDYAHFAASS